MSPASDWVETARERGLDANVPGQYRIRLYDGAKMAGLDFICPCGVCGELGWLPLYRNGEPKPHDHAWSWDGNLERPTLKPSIQRRGGCAWHGYLVNGLWCLEQDGTKVVETAWRGGSLPPDQPEIAMGDNPDADGETKAPEKAAEAEHVHTWAAAPTADDEYRHVCTGCGETKTEG